MTVDRLLERIQYKLLRGESDKEVTGVCHDTRRIRYGDAFVCIRGGSYDGHKSIADMISAGASLIIIEEGMEETVPENTYGAAVVSVKKTREALAIASAAWFGYPAEKLKLIGITGTKGKTTTTYMLKSVLEAAGFKVGLIGTIEIIIGELRIPAVNTTPESYVLQESFRRMVDCGMDICVMEVSSQGLMMNRVDGFVFDIGVFTNLSPDHIGAGEHKDFEDYKYWKSRLFTKCRMGILNGDDRYEREMVSLSSIENYRTFGLSGGEDYIAKNIYYERMGHALGVKYHLTGRVETDITLPLPGEFSVYNSLCAIAVCDHLSVTPETMKQALLTAHAKGRVEMVPVSEDYTCMIDYAHNAVSLKSLLEALRIYNVSRIVTVFGCGGNRSKLRRYEMGEVSGEMSDLTVITSDNPRFEEPADIIEDIKTGIKKTKGKYIAIEDRKEAVRYALKNARKGDVLVIAGKGHEDYQEIKGVKYHMSDRELIRDVLLEEGITPVGDI